MNIKKIKLKTNTSGLFTVRRLLLLFIVLLFLSGVTAIPLATELSWLLRIAPAGSELSHFLQHVYDGLASVRQTFPFLLYGFDWLAFAHLVLALFFIGPYRDPLRNIWVIECGLAACVLVIPFALIAGAFRDIPFWWRLIDCSFGVFGFGLLWICYRKVRRMAIINSIQKQAA